MTIPAKNQILEGNKHLGGVAGIIVTIYTVLALLGAPIPTPAWSSDLDRVHSKIDKLYIVSLRGQLQAARNGLRLINAEIKALENSNMTPSISTKEDRDDLIDQVRSLRKIISEAEQEINGH